MRGIVLAGGTGSRLGKATRLINKHCLPVFNRLMIEWAIKVLEDNGVNDITIVSSPTGVPQIRTVLEASTRYEYCVQTLPGGIAHALACADDGTKRPVAVILGDNMFFPSPAIPKTPEGAHCFTYRMADQMALQALGSARFDAYGNIDQIIEKTPTPASRYAVTGLYAFNSGVFGSLTLKASARGELEITDVLNLYARAGTLTHTEAMGFWGDAGTPEGLLECATEARDTPAMW